MNGIAKHLMIVGGEGHTIQFLRQSINEVFPFIDADKRTGADIIADFLERRYQIRNVFLERRSTNCGNNVTFCLDLIKELGMNPESMIIMQDSTMQRRMDVT